MFWFTTAWNEVGNLLYLWRQRGKPIAPLLRRLSDQLGFISSFWPWIPFLSTFNRLGSRITKERNGVHKYAFGRICDIAAIRSNTSIRHTLDDLFLLSFLRQVFYAKIGSPLTSQTKLDPISFKLGGEPKGRVFPELWKFTENRGKNV